MSKDTIKNYIILALLVLFMLLAVMYINLRTDYLLQNEALQIALTQQRLYMNKYASCLNLQVIETNYKLGQYKVYTQKLQRYYIQTKGYAKGGLR